MQLVYVEYPSKTIPFDEKDFIAALSNAYRLQKELNSLSRKLLWLISQDRATRYFPASYFLSANALSHILDRHYYAIDRYPDKAKFTIPVMELVRFIRLAFTQPAKEVAKNRYKRVLHVGRQIGFSVNGSPCYSITVLFNMEGYIYTAYPV